MAPRIRLPRARPIIIANAPGGGDVTAATMENDTLPVQRTPANTPDYEAYFDSNPQWGRLGYLHATGIDVPIAITRSNYEDDPVDFGSVKPHQVWAPFTIVPHWNWRGVAEYGTFADGGYKHCLPSDANRCVSVAWQKKMFAFAEEQSLGAWIGTLVENKEDQSGLVFRRNRYYDQTTGRFTQEDPIGLAGGLNLYGYAGGDPVSYSDPFGLCPKDNKDCERVLEILRAQKGGEFKKAAQFYDTFQGRVHIVDRNDAMLILSCGQTTDCNSTELIAAGQVIRNYETNKVTDIYLADVLSASDLAMSAHHEGLLHAGENIRGHPSALGARALTAWNQMSAADQASAPYNRQYLRVLGMLDVPKEPVYIKPPE